MREPVRCSSPAAARAATCIRASPWRASCWRACRTRQVTFVGTAAGIEARVIPREGFPLELIRSAGLKGKSIGALARGLALLPLGALDAALVLAPDPAVGGHWRWRLQLGTGRDAGGAARHSDAADGAERDARPDQSVAGAGRQGGGGHLRRDSVGSLAGRRSSRAIRFGRSSSRHRGHMTNTVSRQVRLGF